MIINSLVYLKNEIDRLEKQKKKEKNKWERREIDDKIMWYFERGCRIVLLAEKGELSQDMIDWFLGRVKKRPDLEVLHNKLDELY